MVEIAYIDTSELTAQTFSRVYELLPKCRRNKIDALEFDKDKYLSLAAGYLLHTELSRRGLDADGVKTGNNGKPYIAGLNFNLAHSGTVSCIAVADGEVGVDIEHIRPISRTSAAYALTPAELERITAAPDFSVAFLSLWTQKEAYVKYIGAGLSVPFPSLETVPGGIKRKGVLMPVRIKTYSLGEYVLSVCVADTQEEPFCAAPIKSIISL